MISSRNKWIFYIVVIDLIYCLSPKYINAHGYLYKNQIFFTENCASYCIAMLFLTCCSYHVIGWKLCLDTIVVKLEF